MHQACTRIVTEDGVAHHLKTRLNKFAGKNFFPFLRNLLSNKGFLYSDASHSHVAISLKVCDISVSFEHRLTFVQYGAHAFGFVLAREQGVKCAPLKPQTCIQRCVHALDHGFFDKAQ